jgi:hypothetical protein
VGVVKKKKKKKKEEGFMSVGKTRFGCPETSMGSQKVVSS